MRKPTKLPRNLLVFALATTAGLPGLAAAETIQLKHKVYRSWDIVLPKQSYQRVSGSFEFPETSPSAFKTTLEGAALRIDKNADGELDAKVEGQEGVVTLRGKSHEGGKFSYTVRLLKTSAGWAYTTSGAAVGMIDNQRIRFIDQNNNGRFDELGRDAMVVGQGRYASFLSRVVNIRGKLYAIEISADGTELSYQPYAGETGTLDLSTGFSSKGKLLSAVVSSHDSEISFSVSNEPMLVPAGKYHLYQGMIGLGRNAVTFSNGTVKPMEVPAGGTHSVAFGEPVEIDFKYVRQPGRVIVAPKLVRYVGRAGELYEAWNPFGGSPEFDIRDGATGEQIALAVFGGT